MNTPPSPTPASSENSAGALVLVPVSLGEAPWRTFLPEEAQRRVCQIRHFVVETEKLARQHLKRLEHPVALRELDLHPLPERADAATLDRLLEPVADGHDLGLLSDAGCPAVADPGARLVARAQARGIRVDPLVGPSSILLSLMASGLDGQRFAFHGYLPVAETDRDQRIRQLEKASRRDRSTQIFIETPYRNARLFSALLELCQPGTRLCVARDITTQGQWIRTQNVAQWRKHVPPDLDRRPTIFLMLAQ